jgi:hypothetical protein
MDARALTDPNVEAGNPSAAAQAQAQAQAQAKA